MPPFNVVGATFQFWVGATFQFWVGATFQFGRCHLSIFGATFQFWIIFSWLPQLNYDMSTPTFLNSRVPIKLFYMVNEEIMVISDLAATKSHFEHGSQIERWHRN